MSNVHMNSGVSETEFIEQSYEDTGGSDVLCRGRSRDFTLKKGEKSVISMEVSRERERGTKQRS